MIGRRQLLSGFGASVGTLVAARAAFAQAYPNRPIRMILPFAAGGVSDIAARMIAQHMSISLGQTVIVENRSGGGGTIGTAAAARATPDGYTLLFSSSATHAILPAMHEKLEYDPQKSFISVGMVSVAPYLLVVNSQLPVKSARELGDYARANPGKLNFGAPTGTPPQILAALFKAETQSELAVVLYRGGGPAMADIVAGQTQAIFQATSVIVPLVDDPRIRILAIAADQRSPLLPNVPTMEQAGFPRFIANSWNGISAPAGTPKPILARLNQAVNEGIRSAETAAMFAKLGIGAEAGTPENFDAYIGVEMKRWDDFVRRSGIKKIAE
jgi:tripartite-type tricarboxylate transporter receptor subunit TctC